MLRQWLLGQERKRRRRLQRFGGMSSHHQFPFSDVRTIRRSNPLFIEQEHEREHSATFGEPKLRLLEIDEPKLHVQTWCSIVCPLHLTTCCICKPVLIFCDHCKVLDQSSLYAKVMKQLPQPQQQQQQQLYKSGENLVENEAKPMDTMMMMSKSHISGSVDDYGGLHEAVSDHVYERLISVTELQEMQLSKGHHQTVHFYMNTEFVSNIAVQRIADQHVSRLEGSANELPSREVWHRENIDDNIAAEDGVIDFSEVDSLDSLDSVKIDEGLFTSDPNGSHSKRRSEETRFVDNDVLDSRRNDDLIKGLYETLVNSRHHKVASQAVRTAGTLKSSTRPSHTRRSYADLLDDERKRTDKAPTTYYDNMLIRSAPSHSHCSDDSPTDVFVQNSLRHNLQPLYETIANEQMPRNNPSGEFSAGNSNTDVSGDEIRPMAEQSREPNAAVPISSHRCSLEERSHRHYRKRNYREVCKIMFMTAIGVTTFGIITALSLNIP